VAEAGRCAPPYADRVIALLRRLWRYAGLIVELGGYAFWLAIDVAFSSSSDNSAGLNIAAGVVVAGVVLLRRRPGAALTTIASVALGLSLAFSVLSATMHVLGPPARYGIDLSFTEDLALAILVIVVLRKMPLRRALVFTGVAAVAILATALARVAVDDRSASSVVSLFGTLCALGWGGAVAIGLVLREIDTRRAATLDEVRSSERMELARDLHDVVAHQVTGIIVAAQAAAVVARSNPDEVDKALAAIEGAGIEALTAMRRMVGVLRGQDSDGARTPGAELADLAGLVERFDPDEQLVKLVTDPGLEHAVLPAGVAATGYRVVQEALTNVRRHAAGATVVEIDVRIREEVLRVTVRNDGAGGVGGKPAGGSSGFGLVGMAERVAALDGALTAGPGGHGVWIVDAWIPLKSASR
jgi:signal transduction histidine kinase